MTSSTERVGESPEVDWQAISLGSEGAKRLQELQKLIPNMEGYAIRRRLEALRWSLWTFNENYRELCFLLKSINESENIHEVCLHRKDEFHTLMLRVLQRMHNYVGSAKSLVDHTRVLYKDLYSKDGTFPDYLVMVETTFTNDPLSCFIQDFRNFMLHVKIPAMSFRLTFERNDAGDGFDESRLLSIGKDELCSFTGWKAKSVEYLSGIQELDIMEVCSKYYDKVFFFHEWFQKRQLEMHTVEYSDLEKAEKENVNLIVRLNISMAHAKTGEIGFNEHNLLLQLIGSAHRDELINSCSKRAVRAERVIQILSERYTVSDNMKNAIHSFYTDPDFILLSSRQRLTQPA